MNKVIVMKTPLRCWWANETVNELKIQRDRSEDKYKHKKPVLTIKSVTYIQPQNIWISDEHCWSYQNEYGMPEEHSSFLQMRKILFL